jgi:hypothetical protein
MALATLPPSIELREEFRRSDVQAPSDASFWAQQGRLDLGSGSSWKNELFSRIGRLERGASAPGFGNFAVSENAAGQLRLELAGISIQSLPYPSIVALSGQGVQIEWRSGTRAIEVTAFADGELVFEALEAGNAVELPEDSLQSYLKWLVSVPQSRHEYAAAR